MLTRPAVIVVALFLTFVSQVYAASEVTVLHMFNGLKDGSYPYAGLTVDAAGNLYGTTQIGGIYAAGVVFELSPTPEGKWRYSLLYTFTGGADGANPLGNLVFDTAGNAYSTTVAGGANGFGCVFELSPPARPGQPWLEKVLYSFQGGDDGAAPFGGVVSDAAGNLYGTTSIGGLRHLGCLLKGCGTIYELSPAGNGLWQETVLHRFRNALGEGADPIAGLVSDNAGNLYGTTYEGGNDLLCNGYGCGTVFVLKPGASSRWHLHVLLAFNINDGALPRSGVTLDGKGNMFGTTTFGGAYNDGTVFSMTNESGTWKRRKMYSFGGFGILSSEPSGALAVDSAGNLYGTTYEGGTNDWGSVFELTPTADSWTEQVLYSFIVSGRGHGANPLDGVILDGNGNLYLTTNQGGNLKDCQPNSGCGAVIKLSAPTVP